MFKEKIISFKNEILGFSLKEKLFILSAMICGFCICGEYAVVRPVSNSVFIHNYSASFLPYAWLACVPLNFVIVYLYNRFLPKLGCLKMCYTILLTIIGGNIFFALCLKNFFVLPFIFYIWKEVYVMLMFQQLWSVIHSTIDIKKAKYLYGLFFGIGGLGGIAGSLIPGYFAVKLGSENVLLLGIPFYLALLFFYYMAVKNSEQLQSSHDKNPLKTHCESSFTSSLKLISNSKYLIFILCIVAFMQISATIIDYQFNAVLETTFPGKDLRTQYSGRVLAVVQTATVAFQFFGTFLLVHLLGLRKSHFFVPATLCLNAIGFLLFPVFQVITYAYITIKAFDFSFFGVIKEMLYIPLKIDEKFRAKALIDVFAYRTSKAFASILILFVQPFGVKILSVLTWGTIVIFIAWAFIAKSMMRTEEAKLVNIS